MGHLDNEPLITWLICRKRHTSVGSFIKSCKKRRTSLQKLQKETHIGAFAKGDRRRCICRERPISLGSFTESCRKNPTFAERDKHRWAHLHEETYCAISSTARPVAHPHTEYIYIPTSTPTPQLKCCAGLICGKRTMRLFCQKKTQVIAHLQRSRALLRRDRAR